MADVANTWPLDPTPSTIIEAMTTIKSVRRKKERPKKRKEHQIHCNQISIGITSVSTKLCTEVKLYIAWMI